MKSVLEKAAKFIFEQGKKGGGVSREEKYNIEMVDLTDIGDDKKNYGGFFSFQVLHHLFSRSNGKRQL